MISIKKTIELKGELLEEIIRLYPNLNYVVSIQGLLSPYYRVCNANLKFSTLLRNLTLRDILKPTTGILTNLSLKSRIKYETEILKNVNCVIGRTTWDRSYVTSINPKIRYYQGEENLRKSFYSDEWNVKNKEKYTIFFSQAQSIIKGFYII